MKLKIGSLFITATVLLNLSACSYVKSLFPDKEKDYQYTTEIPPLILPDDLKSNRVPVITAAAPSAPAPPVETEAAVTPTTAKAPAKEATPAAPTATESAVTAPVDTASPESEPEIPDTAIKVESIKLKDGENRLRINVPSVKAWRIVGKALSRKAFEVTERNPEAKQFTVLYDPNEQKSKEEGYFDDILFLFRGVQGNEKTYVLKLDENNQQTEITVVDENRKTLSDDGSVKLLNLLEETIKADLAKK